MAVVHVYQWFRTVVFCPGLNENSSLPEIEFLSVMAASRHNGRRITIGHANLYP